MYLSKLEIRGFKSFPERTEILFDRGLMGVVGPNGCGKTNILDSIRWVLGEQRPTVLRSSRAEEIIFSGTTEMAPLDMAEVTLHIKNTAGILPVEYDEVDITRRLFRSGESECFINKKPCRLKDIVTLFADTGVGTHAYSIFQASMIDVVLSGKTEERRLLFEEAAGITKYKIRRKEATKKLEATEADMLRLSDIIGEISRNVSSLRRQAAATRRFNSLKTRLHQLQAMQAQVRAVEVEELLKGRQQQLETIIATREQLAAQLATTDAHAVDLKLQLTSLEEAVAEMATKSAEVDNRIARAEGNLDRIDAAMAMAEQNCRLWQEEVDALSSRMVSLSAQREETLTRLEQLQAQLPCLEHQIDQGEGQLLALKQQLAASHSEFDSLEQRARGLENELAANQARAEELARSKTQLAESEDRLQQTLAAKQQRHDETQQLWEKQKSYLTECETSLDEVNRRLEQERQNHADLLSTLAGIRDRLADKQSQIAATRAQLELLSQMIESHHGYGSPVKAIFTWPQRPEGVVDTLANLISCAAEHRLAVEAALGEYGELIVCRTADDAFACIEYLRAHAAGRAGFLLLDRLGDAATSRSPVGGAPAVTSLLSCPGELARALDLLVGDVAFFSNAVPDNYPGRAVDANGFYHDGRGIRKAGAGIPQLVGRKDQYDELSERLKQQRSETDQLQHEVHQLEERCLSIAGEIARLEEKKKTLTNVHQKLLSEVARTEFELTESRLSQKRAVQEWEFTQAQEEKIDTQIKQLDDQREKMREELASLRAKLDEHVAKRHTLLEESERLSRWLNAKRLESVEAIGTVRRLEQEKARLEDIIGEAQKMIDQKMALIAAEHRKRHDLRQEKQTIETEIKQMQKEKQEAEEKLARLADNKRKLVAEIGLLEDASKGVRSELNRFEETVHRLELEVSELRAKLRHIMESGRYETGMEIVPVRPADYDEIAVSAEIERIKKSIERLGPVNPLALEEYEAQLDRLRFLKRQMADLEEAKKSLKEAIARINRTAQERFGRTFEQVRRNFQEVFGILFDGGTADLRLGAPDDLLESPIEIVVRPGKKKLLSLDQLSGGERALTAIALLFAIYMVKPSPFCILDEIDAPLDDANVDRFIKLVKRFTNTTQFIIITHNKKTMEAADILYGVTMPRPGVSSIVSVRFNGHEEPGSDVK